MLRREVSLALTLVWHVQEAEKVACGTLPRGFPTVETSAVASKLVSI